METSIPGLRQGCVPLGCAVIILNNWNACLYLIKIKGRHYSSLHLPIQSRVKQEYLTKLETTLFPNNFLWDGVCPEQFFRVWVFEPAPLSISAKQIAPTETPFFEKRNVQVHSGSVLTLFFQLLYAAKQQKGLELPFGRSFAVLQGRGASAISLPWFLPGSAQSQEAEAAGWNIRVAHQSLEMGENLCLKLRTCIFFL